MNQSEPFHLPMDPRIKEILEESNHRPIQNVAGYIER